MIASESLRLLYLIFQHMLGLALLTGRASSTERTSNCWSCVTRSRCAELTECVHTVLGALAEDFTVYDHYRLQRLSEPDRASQVAARRLLMNNVRGIWDQS